LVRGVKTYYLTPEVEAHFIRLFPVTLNRDMMRIFGISFVTMQRFKRQLGLTKNKKVIIRKQAEVCKKVCEENGYYDSIRGKAPSEATTEGTRKMWQEIREGKREHPAFVMKRINPKKYQQWMEKKRKERRETIRKEKLRMLYGLERKTKLKTIVMNPYTRSQTHRRHNALKRGYLLDEDCSEGSPGRYVIYYDDETQRSAKFEANCIKDGFTFKRDE
jgi:hypothetical protein